MVKGWTKMAEGSWRHDAVGYGSNKLNIYGQTKRSRGEMKEKHVADARKGERFDRYLLVYTDNDGGTGTTRISTHSSKGKAKKKATKIRENYKDKAYRG
jgi:hypothetical protein